MNILIPLIFLISALMPVASVCTWIWLDNRRDRRNPLTEELQRLPGETLSETIHERIFSVASCMMVGLFFPATALGYLFNRWVDPQRIRWDGGAFFACALLLLGLVLTALWSWRLVAEVRRLRSGLHGELATAQALAPLLSEGWLMFHDVPSQRGNIDHVLLGPNALFAVESKFRAKPRSVKGKLSADAEYDGKRIRFAGRHSESLPLEQARATARDLAQQLFERLGERVEVTPVVSLPGWYVRLTAAPAANHVAVINPRSHGWLRQRPGHFDEAQRQRIAAALRHFSRRPASGLKN